MFSFIRESRPSRCTDLTVEKLEKKYSVVFPKELSDFHKIHDNDLFKTSYFYIGDRMFDVRKFYSFCNYDDVSFESVNDEIITDGIIPSNFFSFARDNGGNGYYWNSVDGKVYFIPWDDVFSKTIISDSVKDFFSLFISN